MHSSVTGRTPVGNDDRIDLNLYWITVLRYRWRILGFVFAATLLAAGIVLALEKIYRASVTVLIENEQARVVSIDDVYGRNNASKEYLATQFEILKSRDLAERVVKRLKLSEHPAFDPRQQKQGFKISALFSSADDEPQWTEGEITQVVVEPVSKGLSVSPIRKTQLVKVNYESNDPKLAALVANTFAQAYIDSQREAKLNVTVEAATWLSARLEGLREKLRASETRLQEYRESADLVDVGGANTLGKDELGELIQRHVDAKNALSEAETLHSQVQRLGESPSANTLMSIPSILSDTLVQRLREEQSRADRKVAELSKRYGPKHPKMIAARSDAKQALSDLDYQVKSVAQGFTTKYRGASQTEQSIKAQISAARERYQGVNRKEFKLLELERDVATNRQLYDMFLSRAKETSETEGLQAAHARIVDPAMTPRNPIKPNGKMIILLVVGASAILGVLLAIVMDSLNKTVKTPDDVEEKLGVPMLGFLPLETKNKSKLPFEGFNLQAKGGFAEAIRTVRTSLMLQSIDEHRNVTLVTSSVPGEGKSTTSLNLARAFAQVERVVLVDADMRRPTVSRVFDLPRSAEGLSNLVAGTAVLEDVVYRKDDYNLDVMPSGIIPNNPLELLSSKRFAEVLEELKQHYDRIVIDSAPTHAVSDSLVLSNHADELVYIVKADATSIDLVKKGLARLREAKAPIAGAVLNQVDVAKVGLYGSYYASYFENYGYTSEEEYKAQSAYQKERDDEHNYEQFKPLKRARS